MSKFGMILATLEDAQQAELLAGAEDEVEAQDTATEVAEVAGEVIQDETEIAATDAAIDDAFEAGDKVDELTEVAEASLVGEGEEVPEGEVGEQGEGLSEGEATLIEITHESLMKNLGLSFTGRRASYTAESFSNKDNRRVATLEALDGLKNSAKNIGAGIVAALKAAWNAVSNFVVGLLRNAGLMEKHLVNLDAKIQKVDAALKPRQATLKAAAGALSIDGKADVSTAARILKSAAGALTASASIGDALGRMTKNPAEQAFTDAEAEIKGAIEKLGDKSSTDGKEAYGHFTGGRSIAADENGSVSFVESGKKAEEIAAPTLEQMTALVREARQVTMKLKEVQKNTSKFKAMVDAITSRLSEAGSATAAKAASVVGKEDAMLKHGLAATAKKEARLAKSLMTKAGAQLPGAAFQAVKAVSDYVTAGLNNYKPEGKAETKAEEPAKAEPAKA